MVKSPVPMYASIMSALGCEVDANDLVSFVMPNGDRSPLLVEGRRLVLPTPEMLGRIQSDQHMAYHPLCEMIMLNESPVQAKIRNVINIKTMFVISTLMLELVSIAISTDKEILAKSPYYDLFTVLSEATPKTQKAVKSLVDTFKPSGLDKRLINFLSKRVGKIGDKNYRRITSVVFPILDEFGPNTAADRIFDVKMSKKDKDLVNKLLKYILPSIDVPDHYSAGSESMIAPNFDSLMKSYALLMTDLNKISWHFKDNLANVGFLNVDLSYMDMIKDLEQYKGFLPVLDGNQGEQNLNAKASAENQVAVSIGGFSPSIIGKDNIPVTAGTTTSPSVSGTVKTPEQIAKAAAPAGTSALAIPQGMGMGMGGMGAMVGNVMGNMMGGMMNGMMGGLGMGMGGFGMGGGMGGFNGFPTMPSATPNAGFIHPTGTVGINPLVGAGINPMMGNMGMGMGMTGMGFNGMMPNGGMMPHGCVMGRSGKVVNLLTDPIDELEKEIPPDLFSQIYAQRQSQGGAMVQQAAQAAAMGPGFKTL